MIVYWSPGLALAWRRYTSIALIAPADTAEARDLVALRATADAAYEGDAEAQGDLLGVEFAARSIVCVPA